MDATDALGLSSDVYFRLTAVLTPASTALYTFLLSAGGPASLRMSADLNTPRDAAVVATTSRSTQYQSFGEQSTQTSAQFPLVAGREYYLEVQGVGSHVTVGVSIARGIFNSKDISTAQDEAQVMKCRLQCFGARTVVRLWLSVCCVWPHLEQEVRVGFTAIREMQSLVVGNPQANVTMNISMNGAVRTIPSTATAAMVQEAIEQLFDVPCVIQQDSTIKFYGAAVHVVFAQWLTLRFPVIRTGTVHCLAMPCADYDSFEGGPLSTDAWQSLNGVTPVVSRPAYCGRYGLRMDDPNAGGSWAVRFDDTNASVAEGDSDGTG